MERQHILKEITALTDSIKNNTSDAEKTLKEAARLYEMAVLLKHCPVEEKSNTATESVIQKREESKKTTTTEKQTSAIDLFSTEATPETSVPIKETPKQLAGNKKGSDLKSHIGINEKFQFINELFDGNMKEYNVALDQINSFTEYTEAQTYLSTLEEMYKWNSDNSIAGNFKALVERRFI